MVEMEEPERAAAGEDEALILSEPGAEEIAFERSAGARFSHFTGGTQEVLPKPAPAPKHSGRGRKMTWRLRPE